MPEEATRCLVGGQVEIRALRVRIDGGVIALFFVFFFSLAVTRRKLSHVPPRRLPNRAWTRKGSEIGKRLELDKLVR